MQIALISDIHGNAVALEAVLADIQKQAIDQLICLGDIATLGPQPRQVLDRIAELGCLCIQGNHDAALLKPAEALAYNIAGQLTESLYWCVEQLTDLDRSLLQACVPLHTLTLSPTMTLTCFHGSPKSNIDLILAQTAATDLDCLLAGQKATVLAGGHTHIQLLRQHHSQLIINPGSVGSPFLTPLIYPHMPTMLPWAEYAIVGVVEGVLRVDMRRVPFDIELFFHELARSALPMRAMMRQQYSYSHPIA